MNINELACPDCRSAIAPPLDGNVLGTPLVCKVCGQAFSLHFYCPDVHSPARHVFAAVALHIDNAGVIYAFCPEHTFTTYALTPDSKPRPKHTPLRSVTRFLDSLAFRLALAVEGLRWRIASRR